MVQLLRKSMTLSYNDKYSLLINFLKQNKSKNNFSNFFQSAIYFRPFLCLVVVLNIAKGQRDPLSKIKDFLIIFHKRCISKKPFTTSWCFFIKTMHFQKCNYGKWYSQKFLLIKKKENKFFPARRARWKRLLTPSVNKFHM